MKKITYCADDIAILAEGIDRNGVLNNAGAGTNEVRK